MSLWLSVRLPQLTAEALAGQRQALERLAAWAYQWSSLVSPSTSEPLLWLELGASRALFDGHTALLAKIEAALTQLGYSHVCALAPSPTAAALLTRAPGRHQVLTRAQLRRRLEFLPLRLLDLPEATLAGLEASGLRRIGELLDLPADALARRFEPETLLYLRRLSAATSDPRVAWVPPPTYRSRCEFPIEVHASTALLFPLQRMLLEFQGYLRGRDCGVLRFTLGFEHYRRPVTQVSIGMAAAGREASQFLTLVRERLHSLTLPAPVSALRLEALEFTAPAIVQTDLFGHDAQPLQQLQRLLDRLRARLGEDSLRSLELVPDHRPERGWRGVTPEQAQRIDAQRIDANPESPPRPCWLLPAPIRIETPEALLQGPERIEHGWWDGADACRDYYRARTAAGSQLWVYRDRRAGQWYLHGLWA